MGKKRDHEAGDTCDAALYVVVGGGSEDFGEISDENCLAAREDRVGEGLGIGELPLLGLGEGPSGWGKWLVGIHII